MRIVLVAASLAIACGGAPPLVEEAPRAEVAPVDPDGDGLTVGDVCPCVAEDEDGFDDHDGCPDLDDDGDGVVDACDVCPRDAETANGWEDEDGCPDTARVLVVSERIVIVEHVRFGRGSAEIAADQTALFDEIAAVMRDHPEVRRVGLHGHAHRGERGWRTLPLRRAEAVRDALIARGVASERLVAEAAPPTDVPSASPEGQQVVTYEILELEPPPAPTPPPPCEPPVPVRACEEGPSEPVS